MSLNDSLLFINRIKSLDAIGAARDPVERDRRRAKGGEPHLGGRLRRAGWSKESTRKRPPAAGAKGLQACHGEIRLEYTGASLTKIDSNEGVDTVTSDTPRSYAAVLLHTKKAQPPLIEGPS